MQAINRPSRKANGRRPIGGRSRIARTTAPQTSGTVVHVYAPANANSVHAASRTSAVEPPTLDGFGVVVLVLVAVITRIVVLVAREIDPVQDERSVSRPGGHD